MDVAWLICLALATVMNGLVIDLPSWDTNIIQHIIIEEPINGDLKTATVNTAFCSIGVILDPRMDKFVNLVHLIPEGDWLVEGADRIGDSLGIWSTLSEHPYLLGATCPLRTALKHNRKLQMNTLILIDNHKLQIKDTRVQTPSGQCEQWFY